MDLFDRIDGGTSIMRMRKTMMDEDMEVLLLFLFYQIPMSQRNKCIEIIIFIISTIRLRKLYGIYIIAQMFVGLILRIFMVHYFLYYIFYSPYLLFYISLLSNSYYSFLIVRHWQDNIIWLTTAKYLCQFIQCLF